MPQVRDIVKYLRSKNAGPRIFSLDLLLPDQETFEAVRDAGVLTAELVGRLYHVPPESVLITPYPQALAIKISLPRLIPSGNVGDSDVYGAQRFVPLMEVTIPKELLARPR